MARREKPNNISHPWDPEKKPATSQIVCPECGNEGSDGSITGKSVQYGLIRICLKCNHRWHGGIGVQRADFSNPLPREGEDITGDDRPAVQYTGSPFKDPSKNVDYKGDDE